MSRVHYVYLLLRALPEGGVKYYVGIRACPKRKTPETDTKYMGTGKAIKRAVKAHPGEFSKHIVEEFETREEAAHLEHALVGLTTANSKWSYNLREGGGDAGLLSEETKAKCRASQLKRFEDPAEIEKCRASHLKHYANETAEQKATRSRIQSAAHSTPRAREKCRASQLKRYQDPAEIEKTSAAQLKRAANETAEQKAARGRALSAAGLRRFSNPAEVEKQRERALKQHAKRTPDQKAARSRAISEGSRTPQARENKRGGTKRTWDGYTEEERDARGRTTSEGMRRAKAERARVRSEVAQIFAALIVQKYAA